MSDLYTVHRTVYRTYIEGRLAYTGESLEDAIRAWDGETYKAGRSLPGGISVAAYSEESYGPLQLRDGWIVHVHEDGTVYVSPSIKE